MKISIQEMAGTVPMLTAELIEDIMQRWASTLANRSNVRHRSNIRAPPRPPPQLYESKMWESVWPEGQEAIHS